jgi:cell division protein FtsW
VADRAENRWLPDPYLAAASVALLGVGLVMVYSASAPLAAQEGSAVHLLWRQSAYAILALAAAVTVAVLPTDWLESWSPWGLLAGWLALALVLVPGVGHEVGGAQRWLPLGPAQVQVSEFFKVALVLYLAGYMERKGEERIKGFTTGLLPILVVAGISAALLLAEPDFGSAAIVMAVALVMAFLGGVRLRHLLVTGTVVLALGVWFVLSAPYRYERVMAFLNPMADPQGSGFQLRQSLIAFGRGGLDGVGLGDSVQKLFYLPEPHTDFMYAVLGEETGLLGTGGVLFLYAVVLYRGFAIAERATDAFGRHAALGITFLVAFQALAHMGVNLGLLPTKGLTLPLVSYGGSSLLAVAIAVGVLLNIDRASREEPE